MVRALIKIEAKKALAVSPLFCSFKQYALVDNSPSRLIIFFLFFIFLEPFVLFTVHVQRNAGPYGVIHSDTQKCDKMRVVLFLTWNQGP